MTEKLIQDFENWLPKERKNMNNTVELIGSYGGDITHALSAWASTTRDLDFVDKNGVPRRERIPAHLNMLASNGHETPFEKSMLHFLCTTDIATHIHLLKHRIGVSVNAESARYKELKDDKFYVPYDWDEEERQKYINFMELAYKNYHETIENLIKKGFSRKRAKEAARMYLPYGNQITCDISFNFRSFVHFVRLRYSKHAQREVSMLARQMIEQVLAIPGNPFKHSLEAFGIVRDGVIMNETDAIPNIAFTKLDETVK